MSELDFLSPSRAADFRDMRPIARSPMDRQQRDAGATFAERDGWLVPVSIPGEHEHLQRVGIADLSYLTKLEIRPAGEPLGGEDIVWYEISPRRALVFCRHQDEASVREQLGDRTAVDVTAGLGILVLAGPEAPTLIRRLTHLHDFPSGGDVAHIMAHVLEEAGLYWIVFSQEEGHYLWEVAVDRAVPLGGGPVGVDALEATA